MGWMKYKLELRLVGETSITSDTQMIIHTHPYGRKWRGTKETLDKSKRGQWKSWLKNKHSKNEDHGIWSHIFLASRWGNNGNSDRVNILSSKITVNDDCSHEIKRPFLEEKLDSVLKSRDLTFPTKIHLVKAMVFPVVMYRCESWTIKKTESWRIMLSNCCAIEDSWESLGQQGDQTSQS